MSCYKDSRRDPRVREYVPAVRILWQNGIPVAAADQPDSCGPELFIGNPSMQTIMHNGPRHCRMPSGTFAGNAAVLVDFGINLHGGVRLVNCGDSARIRLRFGESASEAMGEPNQSHAIHDTQLDVPARGMLECGQTAFRFVRIDVLVGELRLQNIIAVALYRDLEWAGQFESSDERLNQIWKTSIYTVLLNMQDYLYDGPKRDRIVWMGDMHPEIRVILSAFRDWSLIPQSLDFIRDGTPVGQKMCMHGIPSYSLWWIIGQYDYFQRSGDRVYLAQQRDCLEEMIAGFAACIDENGAETIPPRRFLDWPNNENPVALHAGLQGLLFWAMRTGAELLKELGRDPAPAETAAQKLLRHLPSDGDSKAAAAILTLSGLSDRSAVMLRDPFRGVSTFYGFYMLLAQPTTSALELIRHYWGAMLDRGATTFWEHFDLDWLENSGRIDELTLPGKRDLHADFGDYCYKGLRHSLSHGWSGGPAAFLSERVLGVTFLTPGGTKIRIQPDLGAGDKKLEWVRGVVPTIHGDIRIEATADGKTKVEAPAACEVIS